MLTVKYQQVTLPSPWQKIPHANLCSVRNSPFLPPVVVLSASSEDRATKGAREAHLICLHANSSWIRHNRRISKTTQHDACFLQYLLLPILQVSQNGCAAMRHSQSCHQADNLQDMPRQQKSQGNRLLTEDPGLWEAPFQRGEADLHCCHFPQWSSM